MTPKEKARILVEKYYKEVYPIKAFSSTGLYEAKEKAVKASLICVQEIFDLGVYWTDESLSKSYPLKYPIESTYEFWQEVQKELEKL